MDRLLKISIAGFLLMGCNGFSNPEDEEITTSVIERRSDYIRAIPGEDEAISAEIVEKGKVLISYSDCYTCHKESTRVRGPAFSDIALRYPTHEVFIDILAQRVILGATGAWGHSSMSPHPSLPEEDARAMVSYILSVKKNE